MMKQFFNPALAIMSRLRYPQKFILISFLFVLPLALVMTLLIPSIDERIDFTQKEQDGNAYLRSLRMLLEHTLQNKMLSHNYLSGNGPLKEELLGYQARLDEDFRELEIINQKLGDILKVTESFQTLQAKWQALKSESLKLEVNASDELYNEFITDIRALISLVGNTSNLVLDPDLDSYYLMDVMLLKLPESQELLAQTKFLGERAIIQKSLTVEEREQLIVLAGLIRANLKAVQNGMGVAFDHNPAQNLKPFLARPLQEFSIVTERFLETIQRDLITSPVINPQAVRQTYPILADQALADSLKLWDQISVELDHLLQARINAFTRRKYLVEIVTGVGLGLICYLWVGFYLAVMRTVSRLDEAAKRMVNGNTSQLVNLENQDELGQVAQSFNEIALALIKAQAELEQKVEERTIELSRTNKQLKAEITERQQAEKRLNRYADRLKILHAIDRAILAMHSPEEIARTALGFLQQLVPCQRAGLILLDFEKDEMVILTTEAQYETQLKAGSRLPLEGYQHIIDELRQGRVFVHTDIASLPTSSSSAFDQSVRAGISLPLITNKELVGAVNLWTDNAEIFSEENVDIAREVANQLAIAIQQARLFAAETQRRQEAEALSDTAAALNSTLNLEEVLDRILSNVGRLVQHNMVNIALIEAGITYVVRTYGYAEQARGEAARKSQHSLADTPILRRLIETGQPVVIHDTQTDPDWLVKNEPWLRAYMGVPIHSQGEIIGILNLDSDIPGCFTTSDAQRLQVFADQAAVAIQNARLYAQSEKQAFRLRVLHEIDRAILTAQSAEAIAQTALHHIRQLLPCQRAGVTLFDFGVDEMLTLVVDTETETKIKAGRVEPLEPYKQRIDKLAQGEIIAIHVDGLPQEMTEMGYAEGIHAGIALPLIVQGELIGSVNLWALKSATFSVEQVGIAREIAVQLAIALQQAQLREQVQRYTTELEQRVADRTRELAALYDVTAVASESLDLSTTLERSLEQVLGAMRSQAGLIHLLDETGETLHLAVKQGLSADLAIELETLPAGNSLPGWVIEHGDPLIVPDLAFESRSLMANRSNLQAYAGVPMRASGQVLGVLSVARAREQPHFKVEEVALLTTIADQVGVVVESARLRQLAEQSAVMEERARLARDLHDSVTQLLYSVNLFASVGREAYNLGDLAQVNSCLSELGQIAQQALKEMRLLVYELRPLALAQDGLVGALRQRLEAVERRTAVQAQLQADVRLDLPGRIEEALYHIAQEALNNALKHAAATAVTVSIGTINGRIELEVTDNGAGFDPRVVEGQGGLGLTSMRERVEKLGGALTILSMPGEGTKVTVSLEVQP